MVQPSDICDLRTAAADYYETEQLKALVAQLRRERDPFFLAATDLDQIFRWKLTSQYGRGKKLRDTNSERAYKVLTCAAFALIAPDPNYEAELRLRILSVLRGVGVGVASAILAITEPSRYCVVDFRGWRAVFDEKRRTFTIAHYVRYRTEVQKLANAIGWPVQQADLAIWALYERRHPNDS